ncbi:MAG: MgtC/SapB family protein [Anaerolineaceae bacterium]|nr:MgtC/SapB family protein [Anaerolineaceae bacterium]
MDTTTLFYRFGASLVIGFLVGLQREYAYGDPERKLTAGIRTFSLMGLIGCSAAFATDILQSAVAFSAVILVVGAFLVASYYVTASKKHVGLTTEFAAMVTLMAGALCYWGYLALAVAIAVITTGLLSLKFEMHQFVRTLTQEDIFATLKFAVITAIVLPVLPNTTYGAAPFDVLNPYSIWLLVVFISGISFLGYILIKFLGPNQGIGLTGLLGGMVSSTAVTLGFSERSKDENALARPLGLAIMISWATMFFRVAVIVAVLNLKLLSVIWMPLGITAIVSLVYSYYLYRTQRTDSLENIAFSNPFNLGPAIKFGILFAVILLISRTAQLYFGEAGIYLSSVLAGLADLNAISLSLAGLSLDPSAVSLATAGRGIMFASVANTIVKGIVVVTTGSPKLAKIIIPGTILSATAGILAAFLLI